MKPTTTWISDDGTRVYAARGKLRALVRRDECHSAAWPDLALLAVEGAIESWDEPDEIIPPDAL